MSPKKILVTGADGFIGSHLTEALVRQGHDVRAFVYYNSFNSWGWLDQSEPEIKRSLDVFSGDIRDPHGVREAVKGREVVLHLAALIAIPFSYHSPAAYVETNVTGTLNLLQAARDLGVSRMIQTSTSEVYGTARFVPITEAHPLSGQSPYSATKIGADQMAEAFWRSFATPVATLRPFNTFGPRQSARAVIPTIITQLLSGMRKIRLGAVHPTRDFNYVADTVAAFVAAMTAPGIEGEVINAASNFEISIGDTARTIAKVIGCDLEIETDEARLRPEASEVERLWGDNAKAARLLGWAPAYGGGEGFERAMAETVAWFRDPANLGRYKADRYNI
ncbi:NAD-dependent dehydratase [Paramagnetospirillum marisnigri]|uniref:NAD-dependent dehydratase n=1 Tax=Paramagnetospirillum marisnigri TaxID=1285242 RepID=A0A178ML47_9PROT|nr:NAD-dependent 4,6-dehydratase LegB [Paramagnetospirillum marisnigri]OAN49329.1 NAD-dependent dehydratase [Paramagnetospirillum marisnigri]